ncbi:Signaling mucin MSB2 like protein [Verticillium longisporum]|nr:Signaling mucin MSB2 like protein [Verticillium longisporum]
MQVKSVLLGAALALATTTMAENEKPRIYFPRHVKRQFTNSTLSQPGTFPPAPETPPFTSRTDTPTFITSLRQSLTNDLIDPAESSTSSSESLSEPSGTSQRTTVVISSTIRVPPTTVPEVLDSIQVSSEELSASESTAPQPSPSSSNPETSTSQTTTEPDGTTAAGTTTTEAVTTTTAVETTTAATETTTQETSTEAPTTTAITTASSEPVTTTEASTTAVTSPEQSSVVESVSSGGESGTGLLPTIIVFPTSSSTTAEAEPTSSTATTEAQTSAQPTVSETVTTSSGIVIAPTGLVTTSSSEPATSAEEQVIPTVTDSVASPTDSTAQTTPATTTSSESQSNSIQSVISAVTSILSVPTNATESEIEPTQTATTNLSGSTVAEETSVAVSATTTASVPITTDVSEPPVSANTTIQDQSTQPPVSLTSLPPGESSFVSSTSIFPGSSVISSVSPSASGEASVAPNSTESVPTASASIPITEPSSSVNVTSILGPSIEPTAAPSSVPTGLPSSSVLPDNTTVVFDEPSTAPIAPSVSASGEPSTIVPVTSLAPTKTITGTEIWLPAVALPSDLPKVIGPGDTENVAQPEGTVLLQVGFLYAENYEFVSKNPMAAAQLFTLLPIALADGAKIDAGRVVVTSLVPYDTMSSLGYLTTLARFWYPESMVDQLRMDIKIPNSLLYNNPQQLIYNLTQNINPAIDIIPGSENIPGGKGGAPTSGSPNGNNDIFDNKESDSTPIQTGTAAAVGIGAVTVGVAYGAAMFLIARRYKRKKQAHRRASSISGTSSDMRYTGTGSPAMMGGALMSRDFSNYGGVAGGRDSHGSGRTGNSGRTAKISAPVAAENSLGWN